MCEQGEFKDARNREGVAAGQQCAPLTAEVRNHLQTCLVTVELLASLDLPPDARRCAARLVRVVESLIRCLVAPSIGQDFDPDLGPTRQSADTLGRQRKELSISARVRER